MEGSLFFFTGRLNFKEGRDQGPSLASRLQTVSRPCVYSYRANFVFMPNKFEKAVKSVWSMGHWHRERALSDLAKYNAAGVLGMWTTISHLESVPASPLLGQLG